VIIGIMIIEIIPIEIVLIEIMGTLVLIIIGMNKANKSNSKEDVNNSNKKKEINKDIC
jgi:small neutral amino acid transporter SnatA (MarC family)